MIGNLHTTYIFGILQIIREKIVITFNRHGLSSLMIVIIHQQSESVGWGE